MVVALWALSCPGHAKVHTFVDHVEIKSAGIFVNITIGVRDAGQYSSNGGLNARAKWNSSLAPISLSGDEVSPLVWR